MPRELCASSTSLRGSVTKLEANELFLAVCILQTVLIDTHMCITACIVVISSHLEVSDFDLTAGQLGHQHVEAAS